MHELVFNCVPHANIGDKMSVVVGDVDLGKYRLNVSVDLRHASLDCLTLPGDFDESDAVRVSIFGLFPDDISEFIFQFMDRASLHRLRTVCRLFERIIDDRTNLRWEIEELKCFYTKDTFRCVPRFTFCFWILPKVQF